MSLANLLAQLKSLGIGIALRDGKLKVVDPNKALTPAIMAQLKANKAQLMASLSGRSALTPSDFPLAKLTQQQLDDIAGRYDNIADIYPVVPIQQGMLYHSMLDGSGRSYATQNAFLLRGELNIAAFKSAWQALVDRHAVLRTCFVDVEAGEYQQLVLKAGELPVMVEDWQHLTADEQQQQFAAFCQTDKAVGFDFDRPPLMRLSILQLTDDKHYVVWTHHHTLIDGWCRPALMAELMQCYQALVSGGQANLPTLPSYRDYVAYLQGKDKNQAQQYWQRYLQGVTQATPLVIEKKDVVSTDVQIKRRELTLSYEHTQGLRDLAKAQGCTINTVFQAAWSFILHLYANEQQVLFGSTISGRPPELPGAESMIGLFINTIPMSADFAKLKGEANTVGGLLSQLQKTYAECNGFGYLPLHEIKKAAQMPGTSELFHSIVVFANAQSGEDTGSAANQGQSVSVENISTDEYTNYPIGLMVMPNERLSVKVTWHDNRLQSEAMTRLVEQLEYVLEQLSECQGDDCLDKLKLVPDHNIHQAISVAETQAVTQTACLPERFEQQVAADENAAALYCDGESLTFAELNQAANRCASQLLAEGLKQGEVVGLCAEPSFEMLVGVLGIIKAGGVFVAIAPNEPKARADYLIEDAQIKRVVVMKAHAELAALDKVEKHIINARGPVDGEGLCSENPAVEVSPDDVAYIIYTSGTTGQPKGVAVQYRSLMNFELGFDAQLAYLRYQAKTPWLSNAFYGFDVFVKNLLMLCRGNPLVIATESQTTDPLALLALIKSHGVKVFNSTPKMAELMLESAEFEPSLSLGWIVGGEDLPQNTWHRLASYCKNHCKNHGSFAINAYGPTETCINAAFAVIEEGCEVNIGRLFPNCKGYVLDPQGRVLPKGVPGELYIEGQSVAKGYLNKPELTQKYFNPQHAIDWQAPVYRTGDKVVLLDDGRLQYIGRVDTQVKLRGYRIELGEIERTLTAAKEVDSAVVCLHKQAQTQESLVAFIRCKASEETPATIIARLYDWLAEHLPQYMCPGQIHQVEQWPLSGNGKIDRKALLASLDKTAQTDSAAMVAATTEMEQQLQVLWSQVLGLEQVSVEADFYGLGGDSILAMQLVARARRAGLSFSLRQLFLKRTVRALAPEVKRQVKRRTAGKVRPASGTQPLLPIQQRFFAIDAEHCNHFNQAMMLNTPSGFDARVLSMIVEHWYRHHDVLRLRFSENQGQWQGQYREFSQDLVAQSLVCLDLSQDSAQQQNRQIQEIATEQQQSLNISDGPLFKAVYFNLSGQGRLLLIFHHLVVDGVSWRILLDDLEQSFMRFKRSGQIAEKAKTATYQDWQRFGQRYLRTVSGKTELEFWQRYLTKPYFAEPQSLFGDKAYRVAQSAEQRVTLNEDLSRQLLGSTQRLSAASTNELLLAGLYYGYCRVWDENTLCVALEGHGRVNHSEAPDVSETLGWFTSLYPLLLSAESQPSAQQCLASVIETTRQMPDQGFAFGLLQNLPENDLDEQLKPLQQAAKNWHSDIVFNYLGVLDAQADNALFFSRAEQSTGANIDSNRQVPNKLIINAAIKDGQLHFSFTHHPDIIGAALIDKLGGAIFEGLELLLNDDLSADVATPVIDAAQMQDILLPLNDSDADKKLFFFHPLGGSAGCYGPLAENLADVAQVYGLQQPDLFLDIATGSIEALAAQYCEMIRSVQPQGPYYLFGWSAGARIAYEAAMQLQSEGQVIAYYGSFDQAPKLAVSDFKVLPNEPHFQLKAMLENKTNSSWQSVWQGPEDKLLERVEQAIVDRKLVPAGFEREQLRRYIGGFSRLSSAMENHQGKASDLAIELYKTAQTPSSEKLNPVNEYLNWNLMTAGQISVIGVAGRHDNMVNPPHHYALAEAIKARLAVMEQRQAVKKNTAPCSEQQPG